MSDNEPVSPLLSRDQSSPIASHEGGTVTAASLNHQLQSIIGKLPDRQFAINLCGDRLNFMRSLLAVIANGGCNLLPPNKQPATIQKIIEQYPDSYLIHDGFTENLQNHIQVNLATVMQEYNAGDYREHVAFDIPDDQLAVISFTSGSTGESRPNIKTWSTLRQGNAINSENMLPDAPAGLNMLTTVPPQHMYGLELSVLLSLTSDVCSHSGQPLFPLDIKSSLMRINEPRALVSTPQHLRAMISSGLEFPEVALIFSATAPLDKTLATKVESTFNGTLIEIYGCSEIGSLARRQTAREEAWTPFSAMTLTSKDEVTTVSAPHVDQQIELQDTLTLQADGKFVLQGRQGDLINIAGKRGSVGQITQNLLSIEGVVDAVIFDPESNENSGATKRLAGLVVAPGLEKKELLKKLRNHVDPVFLPRPLYFVERLPRNETSKLPREAVLKLFRQLRQS